jgi:murein DD-endopeptidase MepM/ murein hydrolase activator NlpD
VSAPQTRERTANYDARPSSRASVPPVQPAYEAPRSAPMRTAAVTSGDEIEVRSGDTLYGLSRRNNVTVSELMTANNLSSTTLRPGQRLRLPSGVTAKPAARQVYETAAVDSSVSAPADWTGTYTVRRGDSLYAIARKNNVTVGDLERYNGVTNARSVKPGTVLKLPAGSNSAASVASRRSEPAAVAAPAQPSTSARPTLINGQKSGNRRVANLEDSNKASDASNVFPRAGSVAGSSKLRWPVRGKVVSGFGPRRDGTHNDGVNIAVPMGTDVHAAESGVVAYAGDELKGYGNLILLRHDNGWVTAYAHGDQIMVKRGDRIKRGQVIAKAGRTGQVDRPQVHFELRQGQKPVDPTAFMEKL